MEAVAACSAAACSTAARRFRLPSFPQVEGSLAPEITTVATPGAPPRNAATSYCSGVVFRKAGVRAPCCLPDPAQNARTGHQLGVLIEVEGQGSNTDTYFGRFVHT